MSGDGTLPRRPNSMRCPRFDYRSAGAYFVTFKTRDRRRILASVDAEGVHLTASGRALFEEFERVQREHPSVRVDTLQVMPDHVHAVIWLGQPGSAVAEILTLSEVVRLVKGRATRGIQQALGVRGPVLQDGFHDRIVRDERELEDIREYILGNPARWLAKYGPDSNRG